MLNEDELGTAEFGYCKTHNGACIEYTDEFLKRLVGTWAEFPQSVVDYAIDQW